MRSKKGFTLAEVIISMGIIAVMAALMASSFSNAKPDKTKILYLKCYDALTTVVNKVAGDSMIFNSVYEDTATGKTFNIEHYPLLDTTHSVSSVYESFSGSLKFAKILSEGLDGKYKSESATMYSFTTDTNDTLWEVTPIGNPLNPSSSTVSFANEIVLKLNNGNDVFKFCVQADGDIQIRDAKGQDYINNRTNVRRRNNSQSLPTVPTVCTANTYNIVLVSGNDYLVTEP